MNHRRTATAGCATARRNTPSTPDAPHGNWHSA